MSVRTQIYEWTNLSNNPIGGQVGMVNGDSATQLQQNVPVDIFTGGLGNNIVTQPVCKAHQIIVIEDIAMSPYLQSTLQLKINTTYYFETPDRVVGPVSVGTGVPSGITGKMAPYPCGAQNTQAGGASPTVDDNSILTPSLGKLNPAIYILPGQAWTFEFYSGQTVGLDNTCVSAMIRYKLYDGGDSLIGMQLLEMGIPITIKNVNWYRRQVLMSYVDGGVQ